MIKKQIEIDKNTGSQEYQLKVFLEHIRILQQHIGNNKKDFQAKRSLLKNVSKKNKVLAYLKKSNQIDLYNKAIILCGKKGKDAVAQ